MFIASIPPRRAAPAAGLLALMLFASACDGPTDPFAEGAPSRFLEVSAGAEHTCARGDDGLVWCWGRAGMARVGLVAAHAPCDTSACTEPVPVIGSAELRDIDAGGAHACGIRDGAVSCWGWAFYGQLGDARSITQACPSPEARDPLPCSVVPVRAALGYAVVGVAAGDNQSCAVTRAGPAFCWGLNQFGQLGTGIDLDTLPSPTPVAGGHLFASISTGTSHSCGVDTEGEGWCWGANPDGRLGLGDWDPEALEPARVYDDTVMRVPLSWIEIEASIAHTCGLTTDGAAFCWGFGGHGRLGYGLELSWPFPLRVPLPDGTQVVDVTTGGTHSCVVTADGAAWCFGRNQHGQLGDGSLADQLRPVRVTSTAAFRAISAGDNHTCALDVDDALYCWGHNGWGQLGIGGTASVSTPVRVDS